MPGRSVEDLLEPLRRKNGFVIASKSLLIFVSNNSGNRLYCGELFGLVQRLFRAELRGDLQNRVFLDEKKIASSLSHDYK